MASSPHKALQRIPPGRYSVWIKRFSVDEYIGNPPLIEKLHEEKQLALVDAAELKDRLEAAEQKVHALELENQSLRLRLEQATRQAAHIFILSLVAMLFVGFGVNVATGKPKEWFGWALIVGGAIVESVAFMLKPGKKNG